MAKSAFSTENTPLDSSVTNCSAVGNVIYLDGQNPVPNTVGKEQSIQLENTEEHIHDAKSLSATQLRKKYGSTYNSWKNMKQRCKGGNYILDPRFAKFADFLLHMGPRPSSEFTLDRVDYGNPNYGPDHCRWADKHTQNKNKGNNVHLTYQGKTQTVSDWAHETGQKADTLYHRKSKGWSDEEVVTGKRKTMPPAGPQIVRVASLSPERLLSYLDMQIRKMCAAQQKLLDIYDEYGPSACPPPELCTDYEDLQRGYHTLLSEMKRRNPAFNVQDHFRHLFSAE